MSPKEPPTMLFLNEYEVDAAYQDLVDNDDVPRDIQCAVRTLANLVDWTNRNSDGWPYWRASIAAATKLQALVSLARQSYRETGEVQGIITADVRKAYTPIKAFLTRQGVNYDAVIIPA